MASTPITNMVIRTITADHLSAEFPSQDALIASGAVRVDPNPPFKGQGGNFFEVPEYVEFSTASAVQPTDDTGGTINGIDTFKGVGVVCRRESNMSVKDQSSIASGQNIDAEIMRQAPQYWGKELGRLLGLAVTGAFASTGPLYTSSFYLDTSDSFKRTKISDIIAMAAVGDQWPMYRIWLMHSNVFAQALTDGIVQYVNAGAFGERLLNSGDVPTIFGRQVVVNDNLPSTGVTYLAQPGALYLGFQDDFKVEPQRRADLGGGMNLYWMRAHFMPHVSKLVFSSSYPSPSDANLVDGTKWSLPTTTGGGTAIDVKLIKIVAVKFTV